VAQSTHVCVLWAFLPYRFDFHPLRLSKLSVFPALSCHRYAFSVTTANNTGEYIMHLLKSNKLNVRLYTLVSVLEDPKSCRHEIPSH